MRQALSRIDASADMNPRRQLMATEQAYNKAVKARRDQEDAREKAKYHKNWNYSADSMWDNLTGVQKTTQTRGISGKPIDNQQRYRQAKINEMTTSIQF